MNILYKRKFNPALFTKNVKQLFTINKTVYYPICVYLWLRIMKTDRNIILRIWGSALLAIFLLFFACNNFFKHAHQVDDRIIVHSHPFKSDSQGKPLHNHSAADYLLIHLFNTIIFHTVSGTILISTAITLTHTIVSHYNNPFYRFLSLLPRKFRGPPAVIFC